MTEQYMNPMTLKVMEQEKVYYNHLKSDNSWKKQVEADIISQSGGKIRAFQLFFESPEECLSGKYRPQALTKQDVINMYPKFYESAVNVPAGKFLYIFNCNDARGNGQALSVNTLL